MADIISSSDGRQFPEILRGVNLENGDQPFYMQVDNSTDVDKVFWEYELANTVKFVVNSTHKAFRKNICKLY